MTSLTGYRTFIVAFFTLLAGIAARWGIGFDPAAVADAAIIGIPLIMAFMRLFTHTPAAASEPKPMVIGQDAHGEPIVARTPQGQDTIVQVEAHLGARAPMVLTPVAGTIESVASTARPREAVIVQTAVLEPQAGLAQSQSR